jgi:hypothetical protein
MIGAEQPFFDRRKCDSAGQTVRLRSESSARSERENGLDNAGSL